MIHSSACCLTACPRAARTARCGLSSRTGCRRQDVSGRHNLIAGRALSDRLVLAGSAVDLGEYALRV
jgi:hypothetical protein